MRNRRRGFVIVFFIFLLLSIILLILFGNRSKSTPTGIFEMITSPLQNVLVSVTGRVGGIGSDESLELLKKENQQLRVSQVNQKKAEREMAALRDQFEAEKISSQKLLPAHIIGRRGFVPGVSVPDVIIINKGSNDGIKIGQVIIYEDVVIGKIWKTSSHLSEVMLLWHPSSSLTAQTLTANANGILKGRGNGEMLLQNVVLADKLNKGDSVVTKGDVNLEGLGFPPDLLLGKIISIDRKQSALFQSAEVKSSVDVAKISSVFILVEAI